ncbi:MAG: flagellar basal body rod protein FlgB [Pseudomonadota bacterium]
MLSDLPIIQNAGYMARHAATRASVIAENLANADTPDYRARDLPDFATVMRNGADNGAGLSTVAARATREGHVSAPFDRPSKGMPPATPIDMPRAPNGNNVVIEDQTMRAGQAESQHRLALSVYAQTIDLMRLGLGRMR